jgi:hypothetical protein
VPVELDSLDFSVSEVKWRVLDFKVVQELRKPLNFGCLEEANEFDVISHESFFVEGYFGDHGSG